MPSALVHEWTEQGYAEQLFQDGWQHAWAGQPLAILGWLKRHDPATYGAIRTILLCKDFVNYRLTGRAVSELSDMSAAGLLVNAERAYNGPCFEATGLDEVADMLPELVRSTQVIGHAHGRVRLPSSASPRGRRSWAGSSTWPRAHSGPVARRPDT